MIPIARTSKPESAATLLAQTFRHVLVQMHHDNHTRIRFRADLVRDERVFFGKVASQIVRWREQGGVLISWRRVDGKEGAHDALLFAESPKSLEDIYKRSLLTRSLVVVYTPPTWRPHEETIAARTQEQHPSRGVRRLKNFRILTDTLADKPILSRPYLSRLLRAPQASSRPLFAPGSREAGARSADTTD